MWALRRCVNRPGRFQVWFSQTCSTKLFTSHDNLQTSSEVYHPGQSAYTSIISQSKRFYQTSPSEIKFRMRNVDFYSEVGAVTYDYINTMPGIINPLFDEVSMLSAIRCPPTAEESNTADKSAEFFSEDESEDIKFESSESEPDEDPDVSKKRRPKKIRSVRPVSEFFNVVLNAPSHDFDDTLAKWLGNGPLMKHEISYAMHKLLKRHMYDKALQLSEWLEARGRLDEKMYASRVYLINQIYGSKKAEEYIVSIPMHYRCDRVVYRAVLAYCISVSKKKRAREVLNKMWNLGYEITIFLCNQLILLYMKNENRVSEVFRLMRKKNIKPNLSSYKILMDIQIHANNIKGMGAWYEHMQTKGIVPDIDTKCMVVRHYITGGFTEKALDILKDVEQDLDLNRPALSFMTSVYADLGMADNVLQLWKFCETSPYLDECLVFIEAFDKLGMTDEAEAVFNIMDQFWKLTVRHYTVLLNVYANHKKLAEGINLVERMEKSGCNIGPLTLDALVRLYVEAGEVEKAESVLEKAELQNKMKPLFSTLMTIMNHYAQKADILNAEKIFHKLKELGRSCIQQYQVLLQAYTNAETPAFGFRDRMTADNVVPNRAVAAQLTQVDNAFKIPTFAKLGIRT